MGKIRYTVRLYRLHDMDLITFILTHEFDVMHAIYSVVTAFVKGEAFVIEIPPSNGEALPQLRRVYSKSLLLDEQKDKAAIEMIEKIKPGRRNNFFKNLLRAYLLYPFSEDFFENPADQEWFDEKAKILRTGRRMVKAGKVKRTKIVPTREKAELSSASGASKLTREESVSQNTQEIQETALLDVPEQTVNENHDDENAILDLFESFGRGI